MKRLFTLLLISFAALSCEMIDEKLDDLLGKRDWGIFAEGTELTVDVPSKQTVLNYKFETVLDWEVKTDAEWLEINPMSGKAGKDIKIQIKVLHNKDKEDRTGYADLILSNNESFRITINQAGADDENDEGTIVDVPANQIWYTSTDGEIVEPYSDWINNYADALTTFGVNIVSNTYADGRGVIEFDGDVTIIGGYAFYGCSNLTSVTIPDSVTTIGFCAFAECSSLTSVTIPDSVTTIGGAAFIGCSSLTSVTIPNSITTIGDVAFSGCSSLTSVYISDIAAWCNISFDDSYSNPLSNGCNLYLNNELVTDLTIPDSVTTIGDYAFWNCDSLTSVTIPDSVTTIGDAAFSGCSSLTSVTIPDSVTTIGEGVFSGCSSLTSVTIPDSVTTIGRYAFYYCSSLTSVTIPDSVTTIGEGAFWGCSSLTSVTIGDSVTTIGDSAFAECSSLTSVYISDIAAWCNISFSYSYSNPLSNGCNLYLNNELVTDLTIPDSVTKIGNYTFSGCSSLTSVTIGDSVTAVGRSAFYGCSSLTSVTIGDSITAVGRSAFSGCSSLTELKGNFVSDDGRCLIFDGVLSYFLPTGLTEYTISDSVTEIGDYAFDGCRSLTSVTIPDSVTTIGRYAFYYCSSLTSVTIPDSVTTIGEGAFWGCGSLISVTIPDSVTTIGSWAFSFCTSLTSVYCKPTTPPVALISLNYWDTFYVYDNAPGRKIYVPMESVEAYKSADGWSDYASSIEGYNF